MFHADSFLYKGVDSVNFKKIISVSAAASVSAFILGSFISNAVNEYSPAALKHLNNAVLGKEKAVEADDVNGDGTVDSFDICLLRKMANTSTGEVVTKNYAASDSNVKLMGRNLISDDTTWLVQSGSAAEFTVTGSCLEITLAGDSSIENDADHRSRYAIVLDGEVVIDNVISQSEETITVFKSDIQKTAKVKVIHLSEAMNGAVGIKNISVTSSATRPIVPEPEKELSIEFIGDSITCAYGVEGKSSYESFKTTTENFMKSYAYLTAKKLNADYSAVCYSGHGIISGYTSGDKNTDSLIPDCYSLVSKLKDYSTEWDFSKRSNDVIVINLGTNDSSYIGSDFEGKGAEFIEGYVEFLKTVREKNPEAYIICTLGTMGDDIYPLVEQAAQNYSSETGDERIMAYRATVQNQADGIGSDWHPSEITQQNSAYVLADKICQALGMESDQIGLDVATDAEYLLDIDPDKGGNAAHYVGYDKSFWINMVTGGESPDAITAVLSGISLKSGGKYRLEFDCTSAVERIMPIEIRSRSDKSIVLFSDDVEAASEKFHYSKELTIDKNCSDAEITFALGGNDYYNVTLSNIKLVKIK